MSPLWTALPLALLAATARAPGRDEGAAGTPRRFAHTVVTDASPEALWRVWTDVAAWPTWDTELASAALDGPFADGARGRLVPLRGPSARLEIAGVEPGRAYTLVTALPLGSLRVRRSWAAAAAGRIAFTHEVSFHGLGGWLLSGRLGPRFRHALPDVMERLRARAEGT